MMEIEIGVNTVGVALLVSNGYKWRKALRFVHEDADNMEQIFKRFGYAVYRKKDVTSEEFVSCYRELADHSYPPACKRILVYFSGYGSNGVLEMQDGRRITIEDIITCFTTGISKSKTAVAHMAKMFFFDAFRAPQKDLVYPSKGNDTDWLRRIPKECGLVVAYASTPYHKAYGDLSDHDSRWTNCLLQALKESQESDDVCRVLTSASLLMRERIERESHKPGKPRRFQTAEYTSNLTEFVCFKQEATRKVTTPLRDYTKIEEKNCQLVTHYGGKKFIYPHDVTTGPNNEIVIADRENKEVIILDQDLKLIRTFGRGSGDSKLNRPRGVAVGHRVIAVSEYWDDVVKKYSLQGDYLSKFGSHGSGDGQFDQPQGLCFNSKGLLYVVDSSNHRVQVFRENVFLFTFGSEGHNPGLFQNPRHIAVDSSDQVYVTDHKSDGGIHVFSEDGHFIKKINCYYPYSIGIAPDGYIITDDPSSVLTVISPTHELIAKLGVCGKKQGQFNSIIGIAINSSGTIFVTEGCNRRLQIITS